MSADTLKVPAAVEDALHEAAKIKSIVIDAVEDGVRTALKRIKQGRHAAEDVIEEARYTTKQKPFQALSIVFAAGVVAGSLLAWIGSRRR
jgi:ElaB/YqjD/DUF883 family membrane-anchored ribosome-binding protein